METTMKRTATTVRLQDIVQYSSGAVISVAVLSGNAGSVTIFAFDKGQVLGEHAAPYDALLQVLEGDAEIAIAGRVVRVRAGEAIVLPAEVHHAVKASTRVKIMLTIIKN